MTAKSTKSKAAGASKSGRASTKKTTPKTSQRRLTPTEARAVVLAAKGPRGMGADSGRAADVVYPRNPTPEMLGRYLRDTGRADMVGIDAPKGTRANVNAHTTPYQAKKKAVRARSRTVSANRRADRFADGYGALYPEEVEDLDDLIEYTVLEHPEAAGRLSDPSILSYIEGYYDLVGSIEGRGYPSYAEEAEADALMSILRDLTVRPDDGYAEYLADNGGAALSRERARIQAAYGVAPVPSRGRRPSGRADMARFNRHRNRVEASTHHAADSTEEELKRSAKNDTEQVDKDQNHKKNNSETGKPTKESARVRSLLESQNEASCGCSGHSG